MLPAITTPTRDQDEEETAHHDNARYTHFKLYQYYRSSASWRVRIALNAKQIPYQKLPVNIFNTEQQSRILTHDKNSMAQVPVLECQDGVTGDTVRLTQSLPIIEFLEDAFPHRKGTLLPPSSNAMMRARVCEVAEIVNAGIQPLQNVGLLRQLTKMSEGTTTVIDTTSFAKIMVEKGLRAVAAKCQVMDKDKNDDRGPFVCGTFQPTLADACVVPQLYNARKMGVHLETVCPALLRVEKECKNHEWFWGTEPENQPDFEL